MWVYQQRTGDLTDPQGNHAGQGYSGHGEGVNNPALQAVHDVGPIPVGVWRIGAPMSHPVMGPIVMPLNPAAGTDALGRTGFYIHGDTPDMNQTASHGCVVLSRNLRLAIAASGDSQFKVIP